jgi:Neuraminidase (sialidase)
VLDDSLNNKGKILLLAHSTDGGKTWHVTAIHKPFDTGDYDSFCMDKTGRGRVTVYVTGDRKRRGRARARAGFYHIRTTDGGKTWSAPEHEPDSLDPADEVPTDGDYPEPLKDSPLRSVSARATHP